MKLWEFWKLQAHSLTLCGLIFMCAMAERKITMPQSYNAITQACSRGFLFFYFGPDHYIDLFVHMLQWALKWISLNGWVAVQKCFILFELPGETAKDLFLNCDRGKIMIRNNVFICVSLQGNFILLLLKKKHLRLSTRWTFHPTVFLLSIICQIWSGKISLDLEN